MLDSLARLPGTPMGMSHPSPFLADIATSNSLAPIPGRAGRRGFRDVIPWFTSLCQKYHRDGHGLFRLCYFNPWLPFSRMVVVVFEPDMIRQVLGPLGYKKYDKGAIGRTVSPLIGDSILSLPDGTEWKIHRKLASPAFGQKTLNLVNDVAFRIMDEELFPKWQDNSVGCDVVPYMFRFALDVLGEVAFSFSFGGIQANDPNATDDKDDESMFYAFQTITETLILRTRALPIQKWLPSKENLLFMRALTKLNTKIDEIVQKRLDEHKSLKEDDDISSRHKADLLSHLLLTDENGQRLSHKFILGNIRTFLFAGHETTASALSWALWYLSTEPCLQQELRKEVDPLFLSKENSAHPTFSELRQLRLLEAVIKETLRLRPPAGVSREALSDTKLLGKSHEYFIPKGTQVYILPFSVHQQEQYWEDADQFKPERFMKLARNRGWIDKESKDDGNSSQTHPYFPFSIGARSCIGQQLALAEIRAVLANIVHKYVLEPVHGAVQPTPLFTITVAPHEVMLKLTPRQF